MMSAKLVLWIFHSLLILSQISSICSRHLSFPKRRMNSRANGLKQISVVTNLTDLIDSQELPVISGEFDLSSLILNVHFWSQLSEDGSQCKPTVEAQISKAIDSIRRKNFTDAKAQLELVKAEYDRANEQLFICDRTRFLTCNHATEKCGCGSGNGHKSASAGQQEATGYRFMPKSRIKSYFCYVTSGTCRADPTLSIISLFPNQYQIVESHYGTPKVAGNHLDEKGCLKNLCAKIDPIKDECIPDAP